MARPRTHRLQPIRLREIAMKGVLLWLLGVPLPIILLLYLFGVMR